MQAFFFRIALPEVRLDAKHDLDLVLANLHPLHQRADNLALLAPLDVIETVVDFLPKCVGVIAPFPRYEFLKSPFPEFAFSPGGNLVIVKQ